MQPDTIPRKVTALFGGRLVRWVPGDRAIGDYDGRERTLEVFDVEVDDQLALLRRLRQARPELERAAGGALVVLFHTPDETARLYPELSYRRRYAAIVEVVDRWMNADQPDARALEPGDLRRFSLGEELPS